MNGQNIMLAAITLVISGAITSAIAREECEKMAERLFADADSVLVRKFAVMQQCVELCEARSLAVKDMGL